MLSVFLTTKIRPHIHDLKLNTVSANCVYKTAWYHIFRKPGPPSSREDKKIEDGRHAVCGGE